MALMLAPGTSKKKLKDLNILMLGKSGVGKSTFINSFANYVAYDKLDAIKGTDMIQCPIPSTFVLYTDDGEEKVFKLGGERNQDGNESLNPILAGTKTCKAYKFNFENFNINLIDTPGIVDTAGPEQDKANISMVLEFLTGYKSIHGVCILLKPNETRLDTIFRYCILELLSHLDKSAAENIVFVFTNARSTLYKPGASGTAIKQLLKEIKEKKSDVNIEFTKDNFFCLDSEAFQYLIARNEMKFSKVDEEMFGQSWNRSRDECVRLLKYIAKLPEHSVEDTISINESRRLIGVLSKPLADIVNNISENQEACRIREEEIKNHQGTLDELISKLYIPRRKLELEYFKYPRLICASQDCTQEVEVDEGKAAHYSQVCYEIGNEDADYIQRYAAMSLTALTAMGPTIMTTAMTNPFAVAAGLFVAGTGAMAYYSSMKCPKCTCSLNEHVPRYYETRIVTEEILDENTELEMHTVETSEIAAKRTLEKLKEEIKQLNKECDQITKATGNFAVFLKYRAITPYNDAFEDYLNYLIEEARNNPGSSKDRARRIKSLEELQKKHLDEKEALDKHYANADINESISPRDIVEIINGLCSLKIYGSRIENAINRHTSAQIAQQQHFSVDCSPLALKGSGIVSKLKTLFQ